MRSKNRASGEEGGKADERELVRVGRTSPRERFEETLESLAMGATVWEAGVPTRDGLELASDIYLPEEPARPAPAILQFTPYGKSNAGWFEPEARFYQARGYAYIVTDARGRGKSEGEWRPYVNDGRDGHDVVEWIAQQPWCSGRVGTTGISYNGWTQWAIANEQPKHLACMISTAAAGRFMQEIPYTFGVFQLYFVWWLRGVRRRLPESYGGNPWETIDWETVLRRLPIASFEEFIRPAGRGWQDMMEHETLDDFWKSLRFDARYSQLDIPCLHINGWFDIEDLQGGMHHYMGMSKRSLAAGQQQLIVGPWSHVNTRFPHYAYGGLDFGDAACLEMDEIHLRWFDHWLKGIENGAERDPPVRVFETGANAWVEAEEYPLADEELVLFFDSDGGEGRLSLSVPRTSSSMTFQYDPEDPVPTLMDVREYPMQDYPLDQSALEARADVLVYTSEELSDRLVVSGWPFVELAASSDCDDTDWHVKLTDVLPDGRSIRVASGCLRAACRDSLSEAVPLTPGRQYVFRIELNPIQHAFLPGHRIRVSVTSSDFPWFARSMNRFGPISTLAEPKVAENIVHHSSSAESKLRLPIIRSKN